MNNLDINYLESEYLFYELYNNIENFNFYTNKIKLFNNEYLS